MEIKLITNKGRLEKDGNTYTVYYNPLTYKQNSEIVLDIQDVDIVDAYARAGCMSCTTTSLKTDASNRSARLTINYDTKNLGAFDKRVTFHTNGTFTVIRITGVVSNT